MKVALVYDRINKWGGAERILLALHKLFPEASLYTSVYSKERAPWARNFDVRTSFLQKIPWGNTSHEILAPLMPLAFESLSFDEYDVVISITSEAAKGIVTKPKSLHICYCLSPTRYLWSGYEEYFTSPLVRSLSKPVISYLRSWDKVAAFRPDVYVAISREVRGRIKKYYDRESVVIYPPVEISNIKYQISNRNTKYKIQNTRYFLIVSRLVPYKRIDIAIQACNKLKLPLKIVGIGSDEARLRAISGPTIEFLGYLTDEELSDYYKGAQAVIFPGLEDFGLVNVEAQAFGTPVVAYRGGGAKEIILEGKTGEFFDKQNVNSLYSVLEKFDRSWYNREDCVRNAQRFSYQRFKKEFMTFFQQKVRGYFK